MYAALAKPLYGFTTKMFVEEVYNCIVILFPPFLFPSNVV